LFQFNIPGSTFVFEPEIYVTVIAHTPFFTTPAQQVSLICALCQLLIYLLLIRD